jgi:hypothetical protein
VEETANGKATEEGGINAYQKEEKQDPKRASNLHPLFV